MKPDHRRKVIVGILGVIPAVATVALVLWFADELFGFVALPKDLPGERLAFLTRWLLAPGLCLLLGVVLASRRGFYADAIDGTRAPANYGMEINLRYNTNTLEQTVLAAIAWGALAVTLPATRLVLIPAMAALFFWGRITFWLGYLIHPMGRAYGMAVTVLPTLGAYAWLAGRLSG